MSEVVATARQVLDDEAVSNCRVCVGLSGGLDSIVLLHVMTGLAERCRLRISAIHVNHGLQAGANRWEAFCRDVCRGLDVSLQVERINVCRDSGLGIEAAARAQRYAAFAGVSADYLALAHHLDDQAETLLLQLLRGAGPRGLSAMPVQRRFSDTAPILLRPFLSLTRADLAQFAADHGLKWLEDESNAQLAQDRNFLRHAVLPAIERRFPAYRQTLSRASRNLADAAQLAEILGQQDLATARIDDGLKLDVLKRWPLSRALNTLRCLMRQLALTTPPRAMLIEALRQAFEAREDAAMRVDFSDFSLRRYRGSLHVVADVQVPADWQAEWTGQARLGLPDGLGALHFQRSTGNGLSAALLHEQRVWVAFRGGGERMALSGKRPHRELKKLYQEAGIAPWLRERTPLLFVDSQLAFVPRLGVAAEFQAGADEPSWSVQWHAR